MGKEAVLILFLISLIVFSSFASAQTYSGFNKLKDNVNLFFASGDEKVKLALEIREKELNSAIDNSKLGNKEQATKDIESASDKLKIVQQQASSDVSNEVKLNVEEIEKKIMESKNIDPEFSAELEKYLTEEQKTKLTADLSEKLYEYCSELAKQDYELMQKDEKCNPENAPDWMKTKIKDTIEEEQKQTAEKMLEIFSGCISDPRECKCDDIPSASDKQKCEKGKALAIRCEFQDDKSACKELDKNKPEVPSNLPSFLKPIFEKKMSELMSKKEAEMFDKFAPQECKDANALSREECEKIMMQKNAPKECTDAGAKTGEECEKIMIALHGPPPTECTENGKFIGEEACNQKMIDSGKIPQECIEDGKPIPPEDCNRIMEEKGKEQYENIPKECFKDNKPISPDECNKIMQELGIKPPQQIGQPAADGKGRWRGDQKIPQECVGLTFDECEKNILKTYMPDECEKENALTPEKCEEIMLPGDCKEAGIFTKEGCEAWKIKNKMPKECLDAGKTNPDDCAEIMAENVVEFSQGSELDFLSKKGISFGEVPAVCKSGSNFVRGIECDKALAEIGITLPAPTDISNIPKECVVNGQVVSPEECQHILGTKLVNENIPGPCREAGIEEPEECGKFMETQRKEQGIGINMPPECFEKSPEECKKIMEEKGIKMPPVEQVEKICKEGEITEECKPGEEKYEREIIREGVTNECKDMGISDGSSCGIFMSKINEERMKNGDKMVVDNEGNKDYISNNELNKIAEQAEKKAEEIQPDLREAEELKQEVVYVEQQIQTINNEQQIAVQETPQSEPSQSPGPASEPASAPESSPSSEPAPPSEPAQVTGGVIGIQELFNKIFDLFKR